MPILSALCAVTGGRLFDVQDDELQKPVPASTDTVRTAAVSAALNAKPITNRHVDLLYQADATVDAVFADPPTSLPSPGEEVVLGFARAVAHRDLDDHELAVIVYREHLVDL